MAIPKRVAERITTRIKAFQGIIEAQKARDVSEADTVTVVKDNLNDVFGYDKYLEITGEYAIRGTYCDLAVKLDGRIAFLIEVKAVGIELNDRHTKQAIDYAANQGVEWVILTNGAEWVLYHVIFKKPIDKQEIARFNLLAVNHRSEQDLEKLFLLSREGFLKSAMAEYRDRKEAMSRFMLAAIITTVDPVVAAIRREIRRTSDISVEQDVLVQLLREQVLKREAIEGPEAEAAVKRLQKASQRALRSKREGGGDDEPAASDAEAPPAASGDAPE